MNHHSFSAVFLPWDGVVHDAYVDLRVAMDNQVYVLFACMHFFQLFSADRLRGVPLGSYATCLGCLANAPTFWGGRANYQPKTHGGDLWQGGKASTESCTGVGRGTQGPTMG